jgi:flagellar basal body-associated protein FliL
MGKNKLSIVVACLVATALCAAVYYRLLVKKKPEAPEASEVPEVPVVPRSSADPANIAEKQENKNDI